MTWRLGLKVGSNTIGWAALALEGRPPAPARITGSGVRVFSDGRRSRDHQPNAVARRFPRQKRRLRGRYLKRRRRFMEALIRHGLMPAVAAERKTLEKLDPWVLRVRGLDEKLTMHEFGRALFHLQKRRGFRFNRRTDRGDRAGSGKIKAAAGALKRGMASSGARTLGEFLARPRIRDGATDHDAAARHPVRVRMTGTGAAAAYAFYPTRDMVEQEFQRLWSAQRALHGDSLTDSARDELHDILFFQRKLRPRPAGKCALDPAEERAPVALPSAQRLRICREVNRLRIQAPGEASRSLTRAERNVLLDKVLAIRRLTADAARRALKAPPDTRFSLEAESRKYIEGDRTAAVLARGNAWGRPWRRLPVFDQERIVERLLAEEDPDRLRAWLMNRYGLDPPTADAVAGVRLPEGRARLGRTAVSNVLKELEDDVISYDRAVRRAGYEDRLSMDFGGEVLKSLPYYGKVLQRHIGAGTGNLSDSPEQRYGKLSNPTAHVALNQLRRLVNDLMDRFGPPEQIAVELAREMPLSAEGRAYLERTRRESREANGERRKRLAELGQVDSYENRLRLRLWEELNPDRPLDRRCPYSGERIGIENVFSDNVGIGHILPFSRTLDNGASNKTLCMRFANRFKGRRTPHEAFSASPGGFEWKAIRERVAGLAPGKAWRFGPDAMRRYGDGGRDFLTRQLQDTRFLSRIVRLYLSRTGAEVWVTPGRLSTELRWTWGLDALLSEIRPAHTVRPARNRLDHRHRAVDAVVVALTDRALLKRAAALAGVSEARSDHRPIAGLQPPWPGLHAAVRDSVRGIVVSHKPDHGTQGALHNDTAYGVAEPADADGRSRVVHRVPLARMRRTQLERIRDSTIRERLTSATTGLTGAAFTRALVAAGEAMTPPVRRVRICETLRVIPTVTSEDGRILKAYKGDSNYCVDVFRGDDGGWQGHVVSRFEANGRAFDPDARRLPDGTPLIMRLRVNDTIAIGRGAARRILRVVKLSARQITFADHNEAGKLKSRDTDGNDRFKYLYARPARLKALDARQVRVTVSGRLYDPGPRNGRSDS